MDIIIVFIFSIYCLNLMSINCNSHNNLFRLNRLSREQHALNLKIREMIISSTFIAIITIFFIGAFIILPHIAHLHILWEGHYLLMTSILLIIAFCAHSCISYRAYYHGDASIMQYMFIMLCFAFFIESVVFLSLYMDYPGGSYMTVKHIMILATRIASIAIIGFAITAISYIKFIGIRMILIIFGTYILSGVMYGCDATLVGHIWLLISCIPFGILFALLAFDQDNKRVRINGSLAPLLMIMMAAFTRDIHYHQDFLLFSYGHAISLGLALSMILLLNIINTKFISKNSHIIYSIIFMLSMIIVFSTIGAFNPSGIWQLQS